MRLPLFAATLAVLAVSAFADGLPVITTHPTNRLVAPGGTVIFSVGATGAASFQWRHNGADISGATNATLTCTNLQTTNSGYYLAIAKNATGWTPSQMAYLNVTSGGGVVPFSNATNTGSYPLVKYVYGAGPFGVLVTDGIAQLMAGPELDQLQPVPDAWWDFSWYGPAYAGQFDDVDYAVSTVAPAQKVFYQVRINYPQAPTITQYSSVLSLVAGGGAQPTPSIGALEFPYWPEWPTTFDNAYTPWAQLRVAGESTSLKIRLYDFNPAIQWRKDGKAIAGATNFVVNFGWGAQTPALVITNMQPEAAGVYDLVVQSGYFGSWGISPRISVSVQAQGGAGIFQSPRQSGNQFFADFVGAAGRNYAVECSTNLANWTDLLTLTNTTGALVFSNNIPPEGNLFYRSRLLP